MTASLKPKSGIVLFDEAIQKAADEWTAIPPSERPSIDRVIEEFAAIIADEFADWHPEISGRELLFEKLSRRVRRTFSARILTIRCITGTTGRG